MIFLVFKGLKYGFTGKSMVESKNLKLKLGLCGLALTSFLAINAHSTVHADTVQDNANQNAITWDSDQDDSQVVHEDSNQEEPTQNVQEKAPAVQKQQAVQSAPVQNKTVQPKQWHVAVSNVSSTPAIQNRAVANTVHQSSVQTSTVNRVNVQSRHNNQANANVKVSNVNSDAQMPVQTQVIAKLSNKAKTYAISVPTARQDNMPMTYTGYDGDIDSEDTNAFTHAGWLYNGQYYSNQDALAKVINRDSAKTAQVATVNPQYMMNGTEFLTDTGITYNNHRLGVLIIPKFTELKESKYYENGDPSDVRYSNNGYLTPYTAGFLPALGPTEVRWDESAGKQVPDEDLNWHTTYSYTAVPIDMNTGKTISGVSIDGTATGKTDIQTFVSNQTSEYGGDQIITPVSDTIVTGGTVSSDQSLVAPSIKPFLDLINSGRISPYLPDINVDYYPVSGDHGGAHGIYNHFNVQNSTIKDNGRDISTYDYMDQKVIPYTENLLYLTLKTRQVNPNDARAKRIAQRVIHVNFPNGVKPASYNNIVDKDNNVVQTVTFTRSGTENIADGSIQWGSWQGNGTFSPVTLPDIPGYTMVTTNN